MRFLTRHAVAEQHRQRDRPVPEDPQVATNTATSSGSKASRLQGFRRPPRLRQPPATARGPPGPTCPARATTTDAKAARPSGPQGPDLPARPERIPLWACDVLPGNICDLPAARDQLLRILRPDPERPVLADPATKAQAPASSPGQGAPLTVPNRIPAPGPATRCSAPALPRRARDRPPLPARHLSTSSSAQANRKDRKGGSGSPNSNTRMIT